MKTEMFRGDIISKYYSRKTCIDLFFLQTIQDKQAAYWCLIKVKAMIIFIVVFHVEEDIYGFTNRFVVK